MQTILKRQYLDDLGMLDVQVQPPAARRAGEQAVAEPQSLAEPAQKALLGDFNVSLNMLIVTPMRDAVELCGLRSELQRCTGFLRVKDACKKRPQ